MLCAISFCNREASEATKFLSQQRNPTLAFALPIVARLLNHHLESRWSEFIDERMPEAVLLAVCLDPLQGR
jgi:hypothetical protein